jgi:6,7-dimethyl-8-ribityllumazine synthase
VNEQGEHWPGEQVVEVETPAEEDTGEEQLAVDAPAAEPVEEQLAGHAPGGLDIPEGVDLIAGSPQGTRKRIAIVLSRFNGDVTNRLLDSAMSELARAGIDRENVTVMPVPGAFELPLGAMALAKTRRYVAVVALGCVIRGETSHYDIVAGESARALMDIGVEKEIPVGNGILTVDNVAQAKARAALDGGDKGGAAAKAVLSLVRLQRSLVKRGLQ